MIYNDEDQTIVSDIIFDKQILKVKANQYYIVVVFEDKTLIFDTQNLQVLDKVVTCINKRGLCLLHEKKVITFCEDSGVLWIWNFES